jgi:hypothetical protein
MADRPVVIDVQRERGVSILVAEGVLDNSTYRDLRDTVIKTALDEPRAVIVDVNYLWVPSASAWSVFTSARWHVSTWPDVPILLVCESHQTRRAITAVGVARYVPVHPTRQAALDVIGDLALHGRRRARAELPATAASVRAARTQVAYWLTAWGKADLIPVAGTVATVFIENVLAHTDSAPVLVVEDYQDTVTVAVEDCSQRPAVRHEDADHGTELLSDLSIVSALCRNWGSTPTSSGKTVWALVGRENKL